MSELLSWLGRLPDGLLYLALWLGAGLENFVPAVPADTFVALGGVLAGTGRLDPRWVGLGTWAFNVGGALFVYRMSHRHGAAFFERGLGRYVLRGHQLEGIAAFYRRWGRPALFLSRFLPGLRAIVPIFAGVTHRKWAEVAVPLAAASALWYGGLVALGVLAGRNLGLLTRRLAEINRTLAVAAGIVGIVVFVWWARSRRRHDE